MSGTVDARQAGLRVGRNATARLLAQVTTRLLSLVLVGLVTRYEGAAGLGRYVLVTTVVGLTGAVTDLGLSLYLTREIAREPARARQSLLLGRLLSLRVALAASGAAVLVALAQTPLFLPETRRLFTLGALSLLPRGGVEILIGFINGRRRMHVSSGIDVAAQVLAVGGAVSALVAGFGVAGVLVCSAAADAVALFTYGAVLRSWGLLPRIDLAPRAWRRAIHAAYPFALTGIIAIAYRRLDIVILSAWQGDAAAGQYGAAYKLWEAVGLIPASLLDAAFPEMARLTREGKGVKRLQRLACRARPALLVTGLLLSSASTAFAGTLIYLVYGRAEAYAEALAAFRLQVWAIPAMFLYLLNGHLLYALGRQRQVTGAMAIVGMVNVGFNLIVIPCWGVLGVSAVALLSALLLWALLSIFAGRALRADGGGR